MAERSSPSLTLGAGDQAPTAEKKIIIEGVHSNDTATRKALDWK